MSLAKDSDRRDSFIFKFTVVWIVESLNEGNNSTLPRATTTNHSHSFPRREENREVSEDDNIRTRRIAKSHIFKLNVSTNLVQAFAVQRVLDYRWSLVYNLHQLETSSFTFTKRPKIGERLSQAPKHNINKTKINKKTTLERKKTQFHVVFLTFHQQWQRR